MKLKDRIMNGYYTRIINTNWSILRKLDFGIKLCELRVEKACADTQKEKKKIIDRIAYSEKVFSSL